MRENRTYGSEGGGGTSRSLPLSAEHERYRPVTVTFQNTVADGGRIQSLVRVLMADALYHSPSG